MRDQVDWRLTSTTLCSDQLELAMIVKWDAEVSFVFIFIDVYSNNSLLPLNPIDPVYLQRESNRVTQLQQSIRLNYNASIYDAIGYHTVQYNSVYNTTQYNTIPLRCITI